MLRAPPLLYTCRWTYFGKVAATMNSSSTKAADSKTGSAVVHAKGLLRQGALGCYIVATVLRWRSDNQGVYLPVCKDL